MPRRRPVDAEHPGYDPGVCGAEGRAQCRRCLGDLPHPQAMFCSSACEHDFRIRTSPAYARQAVFRRDHGVCTHCRLDCGRLDRLIVRLRGGDAAEDGDAPTPTTLDDDGEVTAVWLIEQLGLGRRKRSCSLWQADHRVAFSEGGSDCGLGNYRTLCLECHRRQTRDLHRRQKVARSGWAEDPAG